MIKKQVCEDAIVLLRESKAIDMENEEEKLIWMSFCCLLSMKNWGRMRLGEDEESLAEEDDENEEPAEMEVESDSDVEFLLKSGRILAVCAKSACSSFCVTVAIT